MAKLGQRYLLDTQKQKSRSWMYKNSFERKVKAGDRNLGIIGIWLLQSKALGLDGIA